MEIFNDYKNIFVFNNNKCTLKQSYFAKFCVHQ